MTQCVLARQPRSRCIPAPGSDNVAATAAPTTARLRPALRLPGGVDAGTRPCPQEPPAARTSPLSARSSRSGSFPARGRGQILKKLPNASGLEVAHNPARRGLASLPLHPVVQQLARVWWRAIHRCEATGTCPSPMSQTRTAACSADIHVRRGLPGRGVAPGQAGDRTRRPGRARQRRTGEREGARAHRSGSSGGSRGRTATSCRPCLPCRPCLRRGDRAGASPRACRPRAPQW